MKRKEITKQFGVSDSFMDVMVSRSKIFKDLKTGTGYANEYDPKDVCLILIGWEMYKQGTAFRHIDSALVLLNDIGIRKMTIIFEPIPFLILNKITGCLDDDDNIRAWEKFFKENKGKASEKGEKEAEQFLSMVREKKQMKSRESKEEYPFIHFISPRILSQAFSWGIFEKLDSLTIINVGKIMTKVRTTM